MTDAIDNMAKLLETVPLPAFIALYDGSIAYANRALTEVAGQRALADMDRTLFGLGIFHNPAEYRGFLNSFQHGGNTRRLVLPVGRLEVVGKPLILYASRIRYADQPALCGVISRSSPPPGNNHPDEGKSTVDGLLDSIGTLTIRLDARGKIAYMSPRLRDDLGLAPEVSIPKLAKIDLENDPATLARYMRQAQSHGRVKYVTTFQRKNGTILPVEIHLAPSPERGESPEFILTVRDLTHEQRLQQELQALEIKNEKLAARLEKYTQPEANAPKSYGSAFTIVSSSEAYRSVLQKIDQVAPTDGTVLITGQTGTGKELIARAIHRKSPRADKPLVILNCGALPADLIESELFGYRKGAFTGAQSDHLGKFELANGGTLFLDEIGEMPITLQTRLLRVLQDGEITPLGARHPVTTDARIIAATNQDLKELIAAGKFRADLYFRLNVFPIHSIPLRDRLDDLPLLVDHFIRKYTPVGADSLPTLGQADLQRLQEHPFEGNIRELENIIRRALITSQGDRLQIELEGDNAPGEGSTAPPAPPLSVDVGLLNFEDVQRSHIERVLNMTNGKVSGKDGAAKLLGLNPQTLFSKIRKLGIDRRGAK